MSAGCVPRQNVGGGSVRTEPGGGLALDGAVELSDALVDVGVLFEKGRSDLLGLFETVHFDCQVLAVGFDAASVRIAGYLPGPQGVVETSGRFL